MIQTLTKKYQVVAVSSGQQGIDAYEKEDFGAILISIEMPGLNGFDTSKRLMQIKTGAAIIFLSIHDDEETALKCFELGGEELVSKNNRLSVIVSSVHSLVNFRYLVKQHEFEIARLSSVTNTTMIQASLYGSCMRLMSDIQGVNSFPDFSSLIFNFMSQNDFNSSIEFHHGDDIHDFEQQSLYCSPLEKKVFSLLKDKGRIFEFDNRAMFNDVNVSLLIKNMPGKDTTRYGLWIDIFAMLITSMEMRCKAILNSNQLQKVKLTLENNIAEIKQTIIGLKQDRDDVTHDILLNFYRLDLNEDDESFLESAIDKASNIDTLTNLSDTLSNTLMNIDIEEFEIVHTGEFDDDVELF